MLLIAADFAQVAAYIDLAAAPAAALERAQATWPGPQHVDLPARRACACVDLRRARRHRVARDRARAGGRALPRIRRRAGLDQREPHGEPPARAAATVEGYFGDALDGVLDASLGGQTRPTTIRDALSGAVIRG